MMSDNRKDDSVLMTVAACIWLGLFPLLSGFTYATITRDKWNITLILTGLTVLLRAADLILNRKCARTEPAGRKRLLPVLTAALLLGWLVLTTLTNGLSTRDQWIGCSSRREGLLIWICYLFLFFCFCGIRVKWAWVFRSAVAGAAVFGAVVFLQHSGRNPLGLYPHGRSYLTNYEFQGTIGNIDMDTGYLLLVAALSLTGVLRKEQSVPDRIICGFGCALSVFLILLMGVQFGVIGLSVLAIVLLFSRWLPRRFHLPVFLLLIVLVGAAIWFWPGRSGGIWELHEILHGRSQWSFGSNRVGVWLNSLRLSQTSPFLGGGCDSFEPRFNTFLTENGISLPAYQGAVALPHYFDNPHNEYLALLTNNGLPALFLYLLLLGSLLIPAFFWRGQKKAVPPACAVAALCYAVQAVFSFSVCLVAPMFWVLLGLTENSLSRFPGEPLSSSEQRDRDLYTEERASLSSL